MIHDHKLSVSWNEIKNEEDLTLANTFVNAKKIDVNNLQAINKKSCSKRVSWTEKIVQKTTSNAASNISDKVPQFNRLRSILKGDLQEETEDYTRQTVIEKQ